MSEKAHIDKNQNHNQDKQDKIGILKKISNYFSTTKGKITLVIILIVLLLLASIGYAVYNRYYKKDNNTVKENKTTPLPTVTEEVKKEPKKVLSNLDGNMYLEEVANRHPLAVMVENHPDARPQSGLDKAKIVYEAVTEGGITRFMALFGPDSSQKVGPTRSARTYYLDWALEYDAFYAHVGGNIDAIELIPQIGIKDLDQFRYGEETYWRIPQKGKATEHTMFTDTDKLWSIAKNNEWDMNSSFDAFEFKSDAEVSQRPDNSEFSLDFASSASYKVTWKYNKETNLYERYMAGIAHKDAESGEILKAKNIIVQEVKRWYAPTKNNEAGWAMQTTGEGKAKVFIDGRVIEGTWKKEKRNSRTLFYDNEGKQIKFNPGVFWYEIIPPDSGVILN